MGTKTVELGDILDLIITVCDILVLKLNGSTTALAFDSQEFPMIIVRFKNDDVTFSIEISTLNIFMLRSIKRRRDMPRQPTKLARTHLHGVTLSVRLFVELLRRDMPRQPTKLARTHLHGVTLSVSLFVEPLSIRIIIILPLQLQHRAKTEHCKKACSLGTTISTAC
jgi:hypothetical protein